VFYLILASEQMYGTKLPSYTEATTLPTYEEAEKSKAEEAAAAQLQGDAEAQVRLSL